MKEDYGFENHQCLSNYTRCVTVGHGTESYEYQNEDIEGIYFLPFFRSRIMFIY